MILLICKRNLHIIKNEEYLVLCRVLPLKCFRLTPLLQYCNGVSFYLKIIKSMIIIINDEIKKSFLFIDISPFLPPEIRL